MVDRIVKVSKVKKEIAKLQARQYLLEALDAYDAIIFGSNKISADEIKGFREEFYRWEGRYDERY
jgi:hypothetical protein